MGGSFVSCGVTPKSARSDILRPLRDRRGDVLLPRREGPTASTGGERVGSWGGEWTWGGFRRRGTGLSSKPSNSNSSQLSWESNMRVLSMCFLVR